MPWCKNAAFRFKNRLYGFAGQPEATRQTFGQFLEIHGGLVGSVGGSGAKDKLHQAAERHLDRAERMGRRLLENAVQYLHAYNPPMQ